MDATPPPAVVVPTPSPAPTLMPLTYVVTPPPAPEGSPAITQIAMSDRVVHSGAPYLVIVTTTPDVTGVTVEAYGSSFALFPAGPGRFGVMGPDAVDPVLHRQPHRDGAAGRDDRRRAVVRDLARHPRRALTT